MPKIIEIGKYLFKLQLKMSGCFFWDTLYMMHCQYKNLIICIVCHLSFLLFRCIYQIWPKHAEKYAKASRRSAELQFRLSAHCSGSFSNSTAWYVILHPCCRCLCGPIFRPSLAGQSSVRPHLTGWPVAISENSSLASPARLAEEQSGLSSA